MAEIAKAKSDAQDADKIARPYPRVTLEEAVKVPTIIREKHGGNPWDTNEVATALGFPSKKGNKFFYLAAASRDFGFTNGGRDSKALELTELGRELVYAPNLEIEEKAKRTAFHNVEIFKRVLVFYKDKGLPEMKYLSRTLESEFGLPPAFHEEFSRLFQANASYVKVTSATVGVSRENNGKLDGEKSWDVVTLAEPEKQTGLMCFVIMPFKEREPNRQSGFFSEVLRTLIVPAGRQAGFIVKTANRQGSDVIHATIVNDLLSADLVVADLTEHNPNVLFELGMRMANDMPIALIRARGTGPIFDVDNMLRVFEYDPALWPSTVERDLPKMFEHIDESWKGRESNMSFMKILRRNREVSAAT